MSILLTALTSRCNILPNGRCSHFCFPTPSFNRVCGCPYGMKLDANHRDCIKDDSVPPPDNNCGSNAFECDEGRCRPNSYLCDGIVDCIDKTDEANCTDTGEYIRLVFIRGVVVEDTLVHDLVLSTPLPAPYFHQERRALRMHSPATTNTASSLDGAVMAWMIVAMVLMK